MWDLIAIICGKDEDEALFLQELEILKLKGTVPSNTVCMVISDPVKNIGSGASSINALYVIAEQLSIQGNCSVLNPNVFDNKHILIILMGWNSISSPLNNCFNYVHSTSNASDGELPINLIPLIQELDKLNNKSTRGVWITSSDMILNITQVQPFEETASDAFVVTLECPSDYAMQHGIVFSDTKGQVTDIHYQDERFSSLCENVDVVSGVVFLSPRMINSLLNLAVTTPVLGCTYQGLDKDINSLVLSLYFDILITLSKSTEEEKYCRGYYSLKYDRAYKGSESLDTGMYQVRKYIYRHLSSMKLGVIRCEGVYKYLGCNEQLSSVYTCLWKGISKHTYISHAVSGASTCNVCISGVELKCEGEAVLYNCNLTGSGTLVLGDGCYVNGLDCYMFKNSTAYIPKHTALLQYFVDLDESVYPVLVCLGLSDPLEEDCRSSKATVFGVSWEAFMRTSKLRESDLWPVEGEPTTLFTARLFRVITGESSLSDAVDFLNSEAGKMDRSLPRLSLAQIFRYSRQTPALELKNDIYWSIVKHSLSCREILSWSQKNFSFYFARAVKENMSRTLLSHLDEEAKKCEDKITAVRYLACIAELLSCMSGCHTAVRSGPGANKAWREAFRILEERPINEGIDALTILRDKWLTRPLDMLRAARHYEAAYQAYIRQIVGRVKTSIKSIPIVAPAVGVWVTASSPLRVDLQGGWSDTPPMCYEYGGSVINMGILINNKKPITVKGRRLLEPVIKFTVENVFGEEASGAIDDIQLLLDFNEPTANFALLKAALFSIDVIDRDSALSLKDQLLENVGSGIEIITCSKVPQGSGLGTSSILAATLISVLSALMGKGFTKLDLVHWTLCLEQLLTTGGGWQDQVGGLFGNVCHCYSQAITGNQLLQVRVDVLPLSEPFLRTLERHLILIYTGKVRLAKHILQNVVRDWYSKNDLFGSYVRQLVSKSKLMLQSLLEEDLLSVGKYLDEYWNLKMLVAPGCCPFLIEELMSTLRPLSLGQCLTGAGGGGFLVGLVRDPSKQAEVFAEIKSKQCPAEQDLELYTLSIDREGIQIMVDGNILNIKDA